MGEQFFCKKIQRARTRILFVWAIQGSVTFYTQDLNDRQQALNNVERNGYSIQLAVYPGVSFSVSRKLQLEAGFNNFAYMPYDHLKQDILVTSDPVVRSNAFSLGSSLSNFQVLPLAFVFYLIDPWFVLLIAESREHPAFRFFVNTDLLYN